MAEPTPLYLTEDDERRGDYMIDRDGVGVAQVEVGDVVEIVLTVKVRSAEHNEAYGGFSVIQYEDPEERHPKGLYTVEMPDKPTEGNTVAINFISRVASSE